MSGVAEVAQVTQQEGVLLATLKWWGVAASGVGVHLPSGVSRAALGWWRAGRQELVYAAFG